MMRIVCEAMKNHAVETARGRTSFFLFFVVNRQKYSNSRAGGLTPGKTPVTRWLDSSYTLVTKPGVFQRAVEERKIFTTIGNRASPVVQSVTRHYTD
jgi:hypothetical protein